MPSWFSKVFKSGAAEPKLVQKKAPAPVARVRPTAPATATEEPPKRTVIHAPILADDTETPDTGDTLRIKARIESDNQSCVILADRPLLDGYSLWIPTAEYKSDSALAEKLFHELLVLT